MSATTHMRDPGGTQDGSSHAIDDTIVTASSTRTDLENETTRHRIRCLLHYADTFGLPFAPCEVGYLRDMHEGRIPVGIEWVRSLYNSTVRPIEERYLSYTLTLDAPGVRPPSELGMPRYPRTERARVRRMNPFNRFVRAQWSERSRELMAVESSGSPGSAMKVLATEWNDAKKRRRESVETVDMHTVDGTTGSSVPLVEVKNGRPVA